jgi:hypothetical protein
MLQNPDYRLLCLILNRESRYEPAYRLPAGRQGRQVDSDLYPVSFFLYPVSSDSMEDQSTNEDALT